MQVPTQAEQNFSRLFPDLSGDELTEAHRRFRNYVELALEIHMQTFDEQAKSAYAEDTKVESNP